MDPGPVTTPSSDDGEASVTAITLAALGMLGFTERDRLCLRFSFETPGLRPAVELAAELRTVAGNVVQVRPAQSLPRSARHWWVMLKTPPTALEVEAIRHWERAIEAIARRCPSCHFVGMDSSAGLQ